MCFEFFLSQTEAKIHLGALASGYRAKQLIRSGFARRAAATLKKYQQATVPGDIMTQFRNQQNHVDDQCLGLRKRLVRNPRRYRIRLERGGDVARKKRSPVVDLCPRTQNYVDRSILRTAD